MKDIIRVVKVVLSSGLTQRLNNSYYIAIFFSLVLFGALTFFTLRSGIKTYIHLGITCLIFGCIIFFVVDYCRPRKNHPFQEATLSITDFRVTIVAFLFIVLASVFVLISGKSDISRPFSFFILFSLLYGVITYQIFQTIKGSWFSGKFQISVILFETIVASMLLKMSLLSYSVFFQDDPGFHIYAANIIASSGTIPLSIFGDNYGNHPLFHIFYAIGIVTTGINNYYSFQGVIALIQTLSVLVIYLITVNITKKPTAGLFAALLYSIFGLSVLYSVVTTTQGFSTLYVILILLFYVKYASNFKNSIVPILLILLLYLALAFTHIQYSFVSILWLLIYATIMFLYGQRLNLNRGCYYLVISLFLIWVGKEMYLGIGDSLLSSIASLVSSCDMFSNAQIIGIAQNFGPSRNYWMFLLTSIGTIFYYTFLTSGALLLLKRNELQSKIFALWSISAFSVLVLGMSTGQSGLLFSRYYYWVGIVLSMLGGVVLYSISACIRVCNLRVIKKLLTFTLIGSLIGLCFVTIVSEGSNNLDPMLYERQTPLSFFHSPGEVYILSGLFQMFPDDSVVLTDLRTGSRGSVPMQWQGDTLVFPSPSLEDNRNYNYLLINRYSVEEGMIFVNNDSLVYGWQVDSDIPSTLCKKMDKIYSSDIITVAMR